MRDGLTTTRKVTRWPYLWRLRLRDVHGSWREGDAGVGWTRSRLERAVTGSELRMREKLRD